MTADKELIRDLLTKEKERMEGEKKSLTDRFCEKCKSVLSIAATLDVQYKRVCRELDVLEGKMVPSATAHIMKAVFGSEAVKPSVKEVRPAFMSLVNSFTHVGTAVDGKGQNRNLYKEVFQHVIKVMQGEGWMNLVQITEKLPWEIAPQTVRYHVDQLKKDKVVEVIGAGRGRKQRLIVRKEEKSEVDATEVRAAGLEGRY